PILLWIDGTVRPLAPPWVYDCDTDSVELPSFDDGGPVALDAVAERAWAPPPELPSLPIARIGRYRLVRRVASGGQGVIYEALEDDPFRRVALKTLTEARALDPESQRRFHEEAAALAKVDHPNVVPVYAAGENDGVPWIAMK